MTVRNELMTFPAGPAVAWVDIGAAGTVTALWADVKRGSSPLVLRFQAADPGVATPEALHGHEWIAGTHPDYPTIPGGSTKVWARSASHNTAATAFIQTTGT